nr:ribosomal protein S1 [Dapsilanthus disjunctus]ULQ69212.1 ribosomal protein S1 [Dapsilanthus disjunctus]
MFLVDAGLGTPKICMQDELTGVPIKRATRFENKVGSQNVVAGESLIKKQIEETFFIDLLAGESLIKERAAASVNDFVGSLHVAAGEPLLLPQRFRQNQAWIELKKIWRTEKKVKGVFINKVKGGYLVAIAGFITFQEFKTFQIRNKKRIANDRFTIERINPIWTNIVLTAVDQTRTFEKKKDKILTNPKPTLIHFKS